MNEYQLMTTVIHYLRDQAQARPDLSSLAAYFNLNPTRLHKLFHAWVGVTPKAFIQCLTVDKAKSMLLGGSSVLETALQSGLSGPGRLHDVCCRLEAASPGEIKSGGAGWVIRYGFVATPFAQALVAESPRGLCHIGFIETGGADFELQVLTSRWFGATLEPAQNHIESLAQQIFPSPRSCFSEQPYQPLRALVRGSSFQVKVWRALLRLPLGNAISYKQLAQVIGHPGAARAVGSAMAQNSLAYLIPCHRVIRESGVVGQYRWGSERKRCMLAWEQAVRLADPG